MKKSHFRINKLVDGVKADEKAALDKAVKYFSEKSFRKLVQLSRKPDR